MNNEWKMVPVEPTAEMEDVGCQAYIDAEGMIGIMHKSSMGHAFQAMLAAAPVPPAGDVEVLAMVTLGGYFSSEELGDIDIEPRMSALEKVQQDVVRSGSDEHLELVDRAHVTRLTAERDGLLADVERLEKERASAGERCHEFRSSYRSSQDELTKAWELIKRAAMSDGISQRCPLGRYFAEFLARQSAPAAKGGV